MTVRAGAALRKLRAIFAAQVGHMTAYRAEIVIWMLAGTMSFIMMAIWIGVAQRSPGGTVGGLNAGDFASYFLGTWLTTQLLVVWVVWELDRQIRLGEMSPKLLRPLDPFWEHVAAHVAERVVRVPLMVLIVAVVLLLVPGASWTTDPLAYLAFAGIVALAFLVRFLLEYCIGMLGFWAESTTAFSELSYLVYWALGGIFAPLSLYPEWLQRVAMFTPFPYMINLPARLLTGDAAWPEVGVGALALAGWAAALWVLRTLMWRSGLRRYGAVGA